MTDIEPFLEAICERPYDVAPRLVMADWLDENYPATPVRSGLPVGFHRWWSKSGLSRRLRRCRSHTIGIWSNYEIWRAIEVCLEGPDRLWPEDWMDHGGRTVVAGRSVIVGEPYIAQDRAIAVCQEAQKVLGCPVSFSRIAAHHPYCMRIIVWWSSAHLVSKGEL